MELLIIGATGSFGGAMMTAALARGHQVRALVRPESARKAQLPAAVEVRTGDAFRMEDVEAAAEGVDAVIYGLNVPYPDWKKDVVRAGQATAEAAARVRARIVLPGNVYGLGIPEGEAGEQAPREPVSEKGKIRNELEAVFAQATLRGARLLIVRAGDFFGRGADNSWLGHMTKGLPGGKLTVPTRSEALHEWAYLPDLARVTLELLEREAELGRCETFHFRGHRLKMSEMVEALETAAGRALKKNAMPWWALRLLSPFWKLAPELLEMRYLWENPVLLNDAKLSAFLGSTPRTPLVTALKRTLAREGSADGVEEGVPAWTGRAG